MLYSQFYKKNKELIDENLLPLISPNLSWIVGGNHQIIYKKWAWDLAIKMQDSLVFTHLKRRPICFIDNCEGEDFYNFDYSSMERNFVLLAKLIIQKRLNKDYEYSELRMWQKKN